MSQENYFPPDLQLPPSQDEMPFDDGEAVQSQRHNLQINLLIDPLMPWLEQRETGFIGSNMYLYYVVRQLEDKHFKGPDFFVVLDSPKGERKSWVRWEEVYVPDVIIELLSPTTAEADKNQKKVLYESWIRVPEYFWFDPFNPDDWAGFTYRCPTYRPIPVNSQNQLVSNLLGLALQRWEGNYRGVETTWLRWATLEGELLPTSEEVARKEKQRADMLTSRLLQISRTLLQQGMTLEQVAAIAELSELEIEQLQQF